ncbi:hypothetical protein [Streptomyces sp. NBC_00525]|uniref:hypothetical protein n=1 Tax=Streptomyces sp. NBC_00525 TaxID=2903660 RepID=UPI002E818EA2|nr:hypothetical protein [Streptomyces sp. NBC_00525]WUC95093.1 hypothetical protein OG710_16545 [Streptomyces sp. NBC_00525]
MTWIDSTCEFMWHETNLVFARGISLDALVSGLRELAREPLASGEADGWAWAVHDMVNAEAEDYDDVDYRRICPPGAEVVVLVTEPCSVKAHPPTFTLLRDGVCTIHFSFEDLEQRVGTSPDYLSAELLAANLIGPDSECRVWETDPSHDCWEHDGDRDDRDERVARAIAACFGLPSPPLAREVTGGAAVAVLAAAEPEPAAPAGVAPAGPSAAPLVPPNTYVTYAKGVDLPTLTAIYADAGLPARTSGEADGWAWVTHDPARDNGGDARQQAGFVTGFRYEDRFGKPNPVETVFLSSAPACECPDGQHYGVPHCAAHPFHFQHSRRGFETTYFNVGCRRESRRHGDLLIHELLAAGVIGREIPRYEAEPGFNDDGGVTLRIIADHFGLPSVTS